MTVEAQLAKRQYLMNDGERLIVAFHTKADCLAALDAINKHVPAVVAGEPAPRYVVKPYFEKHGVYDSQAAPKSGPVDWRWTKSTAEQLAEELNARASTP